MKLHKIDAGIFKVDGGAMFGVVPKQLWKKQYPCDDNNLCTIALHCLLVVVGNRKILIDTGAGTKHNRLLKMYGFENIADIRDEIKTTGYLPEEITDVVLTHLHFDHCGGCTFFDSEKNDYSLSFPNATHWVGKAQWENFLHPNCREDDSFLLENMAAVEKAGKLEVIEKNTFLCDEIELRLFHGHTVGQILPYIYTEKRTFLFVGDIVPLKAAVKLRWISAYDTQPLLSLKEKETLLGEAAEKEQVLFFEHDYYTECCTIEQKREKFVVKDTFSLQELLNN